MYQQKLQQTPTKIGARRMTAPHSPKVQEQEMLDVVKKLAGQMENNIYKIRPQSKGDMGQFRTVDNIQQPMRIEKSSKPNPKLTRIAGIY
jgi:hypothetical protein